MARVWLPVVLLLVSPGLAPGVQGKLRKWEQLEAVKRSILDSLGLAQPPLIRHRASKEEEQHMLRLFLRQHSYIYSHLNRSAGSRSSVQRRIPIM
eukprot:g20938.t1